MELHGEVKRGTHVEINRLTEQIIQEGGKRCLGTRGLLG